MIRILLDIFRRTKGSVVINEESQPIKSLDYSMDTIDAAMFALRTQLENGDITYIEFREKSVKFSSLRRKINIIRIRQIHLKNIDIKEGGDKTS